jgi:MFS family permease
VDDQNGSRDQAFSLFLLSALQAISSLDRQIISLMVEPIKRDLQITDFQISLAQGFAFGIFYTLLAIPMGFMVDKYSRRKIIFFGVTCWSLFSMACGLARSYVHLVVCRMGVGIGEATLSPAAYSLIASIFPKGRLAFAISIFALGGTIGTAIAYAVGGILVEHLENAGGLTVPGLGTLASWQAAFILTGAPGLFLTGFVFLIRTENRAPNPSAALTGEGSQPSSHPFRELLDFLRTNPRYFICHFCGYGLIAMLAYGLAAWFPVYLIRVHGLSVASVGLIMACASLAAIGGYLASGWIADRWFQRGLTDAHLRYYAITSIMTAGLAIAALVIIDQVVISIALCVLIKFLQPFTGPAAGHLQIISPPHLRGRVSAVFLVVMNLMGICLGPSIVALITDFVFRDPALVGYSLALAFAIVAPVASLVFWFGLRPAREAVESAAAYS